LVDLSGNKIDTPSYAGKVVLINFWAAWCTPCAEEIPQLVALQDKYRAQGFQVIGISMEDRDSALRDFYRKYRMNYPVVAGNAKIAESYGGILGLPTTFLVGRDGRIRAKHPGLADFASLEQEIIAFSNQREKDTSHGCKRFSRLMWTPIGRTPNKSPQMPPFFGGSPPSYDRLWRTGPVP
jgi:thiol-disulfide isomerase/thioredoxin